MWADDPLHELEGRQTYRALAVPRHVIDLLQHIASALASHLVHVQNLGVNCKIIMV